MRIFFRLVFEYCVLALAALGLTLTAMPVQAQQALTTTGGQVELPDIIAGIIHYTRWPGNPGSIRLCLNENDTDSASIAEHFELGYKDPPKVVAVVRRLQADSGDKLIDCHVVYFGKVNAKETSALLIQLGKHPILTIGHSEDFCSYSGLFCLVPQSSGYRIGANLDSISRNGLRVNPLLLKFTARDKRGAT